MHHLLRQHPQQLGTEYLFPGIRGHRIDINKSLYAAATQAGIEKITMHQLRHAFCSHALMAGVDPRTVQLWMGHANINTTLRYAHSSPAHEREAMQRISYRDEVSKEDDGTGGI